MANEGSASLLQFMKVEGLRPMAEEEERRRIAIEKLKEILVGWIKKVAWQRHLKKSEISGTSATILTYGSDGLGVHDMESDVDALCVGPLFATKAEDFFIVLFNMLKSREEVSELQAMKRARFPRMQFRFEGISICLSYAQLTALSFPENIDELDQFSLLDIDQTSWKGLSAVRSYKHILHLVPNFENFQSLLQCVKVWAKRRGIYGSQCGFLGGLHLAVFSAYVCRRNPLADLITLLSEFFKTFALWAWPAPVVLQEGISPAANAIGDQTEACSFMPIRLPCISPDEYHCNSNITRSTFYKIRVELLRGHKFTKDSAREELYWDNIFEQFAYSKRYTRFLKIYLSASSTDELGEWVEMVKSKFRILLLMVEELHGICDPNPTHYTDTQVGTVFYWGLQPGRSSGALDVQSIRESFMKYVEEEDCDGSLELSVVLASQLPENEKNIQCCKGDQNKQQSQHISDNLVGGGGS